MQTIVLVKRPHLIATRYTAGERGDVGYDTRTDGAGQ